MPLTGTAALGGVTQVPGPAFHRLDMSLFKEFPINERFRLQFRAEIFNIANHPSFDAPNFGGNGVVAMLELGTTTAQPLAKSARRAMLLTIRARSSSPSSSMIDVDGSSTPRRCPGTSAEFFFLEWIRV